MRLRLSSAMHVVALDGGGKDIWDSAVHVGASEWLVLCTWAPQNSDGLGSRGSQECVKQY